MEPDAFQLSRIYAQGWNAAKKLLADGEADSGPAMAGALNPHSAPAEAARWAKGFEDAFQSRTAPSQTRGASAFAPSARHGSSGAEEL